ncbi:HEAT repeat domain-containing protein [Rhodoferax saidenbachensis]|uniref:HEAT repeat domain-containing protein n=1 Tax=Rhodoferax saidenbachensis TaxID=1484693 RepID=A0ABU1ZQ42_9BURK|nr:HEAT repeat domain-containing protein [Rhodoferax saidenbachensis]MDR7307650.1 hypothetical protein [Rhodoferax saidenbachensis]
MSFPDFLSKLFKSVALPTAGMQTPSDSQYPWGREVYGLHDTAYSNVYFAWRKDQRIPAARLQALSPTTAIERLDNRSGYVREFSLRVLMAQDWVDGLQPVTKRLNDYVPVNRELSLQLVLHWLAHMPFESLVDALPALYALETQSRADFQQVLAALQARLAEPQNRDLVLAGTSHGSAKVRFQCWRLCLALYDWSDLEKVERAIESGDSALARSVEPLVYKLADSELQALLTQRHHLKAMALRRAVYLSLWRRKLGDTDELLSIALWDPSFSIRWLARHWSKDQPQVLVAAYRRVLAEPVSIRLKRYALEGLGQLGRADTMDCCEAALLDVNPSLRKAALVALCSFTSATRYAYLTQALNDGDLAVVRMCFELSLNTGDHLAYDDLLPVVQARSQELDFFVRLVEYAGHVSVWLSIHLVSLTRLAGADVQGPLKPHVDNFLNRWGQQQIYFAPSKKQWADVDAWIPYETLAPRSALRFALEGEAKRMKARG